MNQPDDYYGAIIRERMAPDAADALADLCRRKDAALALSRLWRSQLTTAIRQACDLTAACQQFPDPVDRLAQIAQLLESELSRDKEEPR